MNRRFATPTSDRLVGGILFVITVIAGLILALIVLQLVGAIR